MSCLHLVSFGADAESLQQLKTTLAADDAVVLMGAARSLASRLRPLTQPLYLWRAADDGATSETSASSISADELVALTLEYDHTMSWHDRI